MLGELLELFLAGRIDQLQVDLLKADLQGPAERLDGRRQHRLDGRRERLAMLPCEFYFAAWMRVAVRPAADHE